MCVHLGEEKGTSLIWGGNDGVRGMSRTARSVQAGLMYHVLNRGNGHMRLFHKDADFAAFKDVLAEGLERYPVDLLTYCLMSDHWSRRPNGASCRDATAPHEGESRAAHGLGGRHPRAPPPRALPHPRGWTPACLPACLPPACRGGLSAGAAQAGAGRCRHRQGRPVCRGGTGRRRQVPGAVQVLPDPGRPALPDPLPLRRGQRPAGGPRPAGGGLALERLGRTATPWSGRRGGAPMLPVARGPPFELESTGQRSPGRGRPGPTADQRPPRPTLGQRYVGPTDTQAIGAAVHAPERRPASQE